jgi:branched-chain amino acid aminotransferase
MANIFKKAYFGDRIIEADDARVSVASSAVLYGLSVYTVFPVCAAKSGIAAFRLGDHFRRLVNSARIIGMDTFESEWTYEKFDRAVKDLVRANGITEDVLVRATVHVNDLVPGTRSRGLSNILSMFIYTAKPILPQDGARLKTSVWRRIPDFAIPSRAKVNGAYVNSVLAKQDALDSGYDDSIFLDTQGHVCELSAANLFAVRDGTLITPSSSCDILEGITRRTILEIAPDLGIRVEERTIDLTELYIADEVFASGTSAYVAPVTEIDARRIGTGTMGPTTARIRAAHHAILHGESAGHGHLLTLLN